MKDDIIYRQQAIDGMRNLQRWNVVRGYNKNEGFLYDDVMYLLEKLPSAQPECPEWVRKVELMHSKAMKMPYIKKPMAWALYQVWKEYDNE